MVTTATPLLALTVEDVMSREVVTIPRQMSLRDAARLLRRAQVSGAPVVDEQGRCVGVLSAADFLRWAEEGCPGDDWPAGTVRRYMTTDVVTVGPQAPLPELAQMMVDAHIHRVPVIDGRGRPVGVVSSTDVLAAVARDGLRSFGATEQPGWPTQTPKEDRQELSVASPPVT